MYHFKRAQDFPFFYSGKARVFPIHCGRTLQLTAAQEKELFDRIEQRLRRKDLTYAFISEFLEIAYEFCGYRFSASWMSDLLKRHGAFYGRPVKAAGATTIVN